MSRARILAYGGPSVGFASGLFFLEFYFLKFSTDVLLLAPAAVGVLFAAGRIVDAISNPVVGFLSDRTVHRLGRRRPWLLGAIVPFCGALFMLWNPPQAMAAPGLLAWTACGLFLFYIAHASYEIPYLALGMELSPDFHERSRIFGVQRMAFTFGMIMAFALIQVVATSAAPRAVAGQVGLGLALAVALLLLIPPLVLREGARSQGRGAGSPARAARDVFANHHARRLLAVWFIDGLGGGTIGVLAPYVSEYVLKRPDLTGVLPAAYVFSAIASIPGWVWLSRRLGKRQVYLWALVACGTCFGATMLLGEGDLVPIILLMIGAGATGGCATALGPSILADVIDHDEVETRQRKEGAYSAATGFAYKLATGIVIFAAGAALEAAGFVPNKPQAPGTVLTLKVLFGGLPLVGFLTAAWVFRGYSLDEAEHRRLRGILEARAGEG